MLKNPSKPAKNPSKSTHLEPALPPNAVVVCVSGGCVQAVYAHGQCPLLVVDWDNIKAGDHPKWLAADDPATIHNDGELASLVRSKLADLDAAALAPNGTTTQTGLIQDCVEATFIHLGVIRRLRRHANKLPKRLAADVQDVVEGMQITAAKLSEAAANPGMVK